MRPPPPRVACLLVPDLPLVAALRAHPERVGRPLAIASGPGPRAEIIPVSPEAARAGVRPLSSAVQARAACAELSVCIASPALERAARDALLDAALSCSPRAAPGPRASGAYAGEAAVHLDASGITSLFHSEAGFAAALAARAQNLGLRGAVAVAGSRSVAHLAARLAGARLTGARLRSAASSPGASEVLVLPSGAEGDFLAPLPIDLLDPDDELAEALTRFGVRSIGELVRLPRRGLLTRLGPKALGLVALARGEEVDAPLPHLAESRLEEAIDLEFPIDQLEPLTFVVRGLLSRLARRLETRSLTCGDLDLTLGLGERARDARRIGVAAPTLDVRVLLRLVYLALEARPPDAPVETVQLATVGAPARSDQLDFFRPPGPAPAVLSRTLAELEALCGSGRIGAPEVADDHDPQAFGLTPFAHAEPRARGGQTPQGKAAKRPRSEAQQGRRPRSEPKANGGRLLPDANGGRPCKTGLQLAVRALRPPVPAWVRVRHGRPEWVESAVARGRVVHLAGPWRTTGAWWSRVKHFAYDSFDLQTSDGALTRLRFDLIHETWHVDAVYD